LSTARNSLAVAVLGDKLYAIGGIDSQYQYLSSVECLDLSVPNSQWTTVAPMTTPRCAMGAVVTGGKIYIAGGYGSSSIESWHVAVECFDPSDGPAGRWAVVSETSQFEGGARFSAC
jgi:kelch-like protein 12